MKWGALGWLFFPLCGTAQIVNTEAVRMAVQDTGWSVRQTAGFSLLENDGRIFRLNHAGRIQYRRPKHRVMLITNYSLLFEKDEEDLVNNGFAHLRYTFYPKKRLGIEAFEQAQRNTIQDLAFRNLTGAGVRVEALALDSIPFYINAGATYMLEYETLLDTVDRKIDHRASFYLNMAWRWKNRLQISHTTYIQPRVQDWRDARVFTQTNFDVFVTDRVAITNAFELFYDTAPPVEVPKTFFSLLTGVTLIF